MIQRDSRRAAATEERLDDGSCCDCYFVVGVGLLAM